MTSVLPLLALAPAAVAGAKASVAETILAAKAVATSELDAWRKIHSKADLTIDFGGDRMPKYAEWSVRKSLGYKNTIPVLDAQVLTIVVASVERTAKPRQVEFDGFVFQGSFPKGFHARYLVETGGKAPRILSRTLLERYDIKPIKLPT